MEILQERTQTQAVDTSLEAQQHNARIAERYERLKNLRNAQQEQCQETETVRASAVTAEPVRPTFTAQPTVAETPVMQQTPQVTEYAQATMENSFPFALSALIFSATLLMS